VESIRKFIDASTLMSIMPLPEALQNRRLEIIVLPADEPVSSDNGADVTQIVQSLVGAIPHTDQSLREMREERLSKYEAAH